MGNSKFDLIKKTADKAAHKRTKTETAPAVKPAPALSAAYIPAKTVRDNQSFYVGDARDIIAALKPRKLSEAVQIALKHAYKDGLLNDLLEG